MTSFCAGTARLRNPGPNRGGIPRIHAPDQNPADFRTATRNGPKSGHDFWEQTVHKFKFELNHQPGRRYFLEVVSRRRWPSRLVEVTAPCRIRFWVRSILSVWRVAHESNFVYSRYTD